jgi:hypothetical protein
MHHSTHDVQNRLFAVATIALLSLGSAALAGDSFLRSTRGLTDIDDRATDTDRGDVSKARLREGTLIPPTPGRIVLIGRRWAFIPDRADAAQSDPLAMTGELPATPLPAASRPDSTSRPFGYRSSGDPSVGGNVDPATPVNSPVGARGKPTGQMLISENLMLQRIAEAIREDAADDRWTVSGQVSEFFEQNRLIIRTAQRSGGN